MKKLLILFLLIALFSCRKDHLVTLTGTWKLVKMRNLEKGTIESEPSDVAHSDIWHSIIMDFSDDGKAGNFTGKTTGNDIDGGYELSNGNSFKVLGIAGTKAGEHDWGYMFWKAMLKANSFTIRGNTLLIYFDEGYEYYHLDAGILEWERIEGE